MILVVLGLVSLVFYTVAASYTDLLRSGSLAVKLVSIMVLLTFTGLVRLCSLVCPRPCSSWQRLR